MFYLLPLILPRIADRTNPKINIVNGIPIPPIIEKIILCLDSKFKYTAAKPLKIQPARIYAYNLRSIDYPAILPKIRKEGAAAAPTHLYIFSYLDFAFP